MDIKNFKTFLLVAKLLNVTQAAEQLNFTQPAVTTQIHTLEKTFGVSLFERVGKKMFLTEAGEHLIDYATRILQLYEETYDVLAGYRQCGELSLGVSTQMINYFLPPILGKLQKNLPTVSLAIEVCMNTQEVLKGLLNNRFDFGFIHGQNYMQQLTEVGIWVEPILWVGSSELIKIHGDDSNIRNYPIVNFTVGSVFRAKFDEVIKKTWPQPSLSCPYLESENAIFSDSVKKQCISPSIEFSDSEAVKQAVLSGLGISFLPRVLVEKEIRDGILTQLTNAPKLEMMISLVYHKNKEFTVPMKELLSILADEKGRTNHP